MLCGGFFASFGGLFVWREEIQGERFDRLTWDRKGDDDERERVGVGRDPRLGRVSLGGDNSSGESPLPPLLGDSRAEPNKRGEEGSKVRGGGEPTNDD